jgi:predicted proteasome-type protease
MTYCVGERLDQGMLFAPDSHANAGVDNVAKCCRMTGFERGGDRVIVPPSSGNLASTQAVIGVPNTRCASGDAAASLRTAQTIFDVAVREIEWHEANACRKTISAAMPRSLAAGNAARSIFAARGASREPSRLVLTGDL